MTFLRVLSIALLIIGCDAGEEERLTLEGTTWVAQNAEWTGTGGVEPNLEFSMNLSPLYFGANGCFNQMAWITYRDLHTKALSLGGEGGVRIGGVWRIQADTVYVAHQIVDRAVSKLAEVLPGPITVESVSLTSIRQPSPRIIFAGITYVPEERFNNRSAMLLSTPLWEDSLPNHLMQHLDEFLISQIDR